ncbi:hypothetical protein M1O19_06860 [Dehalococcoidia bacterium]|nr:hypothetical protein [Dehalococcoidia bacterium]
MGVFDTIYLDRHYVCLICGQRIESVQVKQFENLLEDYQVKDCVSHAEDVRIVKEELFCSSCSKLAGTSIYLVANRGIFMGTARTLEEARRLLEDLNLEKLILWYHDLYRKYVAERTKKQSYRKFLKDLREWYGERLYEKTKEELAGRLWLGWNSRHLKGSLSPVESVDRFLSYEQMLESLDKLWQEGFETLEIYYLEAINPGEEDWWVDVYQDELNERCRLNWTWTVMSKKRLEAEGEKEDELPEWTIVVEEPFSDEVVRRVINKWLQGRRYEFEVRLISPEQAKGSGLFRELRERSVGVEKEEAMSLEQLAAELSREESERTTDMIERCNDRRKVFYCEGFYGSLVPDVESDRLVGKIEGIKEKVVYEGKTVRESEQKFREAVLKYKSRRKDKNTSAFGLQPK